MLYEAPGAVQCEAQIFYLGPNRDGHIRDHNVHFRWRPSETVVEEHGFRFFGAPHLVRGRGCGARCRLHPLDRDSQVPSREYRCVIRIADDLAARGKGW